MEIECSEMSADEILVRHFQSALDNSSFFDCLFFFEVMFLYVARWYFAYKMICISYMLLHSVDVL